MENAKSYAKYGVIVTDLNTFLADDIIKFLNTKGYSTLVNKDDDGNTVITVFNEK